MMFYNFSVRSTSLMFSVFSCSHSLWRSLNSELSCFRLISWYVHISSMFLPVTAWDCDSIKIFFFSFYLRRFSWSICEFMCYYRSDNLCGCKLFPEASSCTARLLMFVTGSPFKMLWLMVDLSTEFARAVR